VSPEAARNSTPDMSIGMSIEAAELGIRNKASAELGG
jgi:hypothetical protein